VRYAPVVFQEYVDAELEVRVTVVGERIFAAAFDLTRSRYPYDVRMDARTPCRAFALDDATAATVLRLVRGLGLVYAAVDLRLARDGTPVFLELNPAGQFLYIEDLTGLPIAAALADELLATGRSER
jgi:glutathione synthase/RimK-type ligase-like ATP-grasp enzyme